MSSRRTFTILALSTIVVSVAIILKKKSTPKLLEEWPAHGEVAHTHNGVPIYSNGTQVFQSSGKHTADDGYYYGRKWQCVEFVKRYYHDAHDHHMPNVWGHAKDFYQNDLSHGSLNQGRGMLQFHNGKDTPPMVDDLIVWNDAPYGHVAVIAEVHDTYIVVAQQNIYGSATQRFPLSKSKGSFTITGTKPPAGWLRLP